MDSATAFAAVFAALYAAHSFGDHWVQTHHQACRKGDKGPAGRFACARHIVTLTGTKMFAPGLVMLVTGLRLDGTYLLAGLFIDAASHYWADRRVTLARLARRLGKQEFYELGQGARCMGTGAYALDQSWHVAWLFIAALIIAGGS